MSLSMRAPSPAHGCSFFVYVMSPGRAVSEASILLLSLTSLHRLDQTASPRLTCPPSPSGNVDGAARLREEEEPTCWARSEQTLLARPAT